LNIENENENENSKYYCLSLKTHYLNYNKELSRYFKNAKLTKNEELNDQNLTKQ
jgi:hypothetical protein